MVSGLGSSPRGRGKRYPAGLARPRRRLIPARAGKTPCRGGRTPPRTAHPRAGGENMTPESDARPNRGSSPRGRGKRAATSRGRTSPRLIPARAGKTGCGTAPPLFARAHPRAGGENVESSLHRAGRHGSSPRGRGKLASETYTGRDLRLIPARAGKTPARRSTATSRRAHPRAGGENTSDRAPGLSEYGSSPRGRGKLARALHLEANRGLIPARAGKTRSPGRRLRCRRAHPRAGGENAA